MSLETTEKLQKIWDELNINREVLNIEVLSQKLSQLNLNITPSEIPQIIDNLKLNEGRLFVPKLIIDVMKQLLQKETVQSICDPWAGIGTLIALLQESTNAEKALACSPMVSEANLGKVLAKNVEWHLADPLDWVNSLGNELDAIVSILPFGGKQNRNIELINNSGELISIHDDLGNMILASFSTKLNANGIGLFVVTPNFFFNPRSVYREFNTLGIGIEAALELPSGSFAPYANVMTYLIIVRKRIYDQMFVAQLSNDTTTNQEIISNFRQHKDGGKLELGRFVLSSSFKGLDNIQSEEKFKQEEKRFGVPPIKIGEIALSINMGRYGSDFKFPKCINEIYIPTIGNRDVVVSIADLEMKQQNYAQVIIDPSKSFADFVSNFLNSEFGKEMRENAKRGAVIMKLNKKSLGNIPVFIPNLNTQKDMLGIEANIAVERNLLRSLDNELINFRTNIWTNPQAIDEVKNNFNDFSQKLSGGLKKRSSESLEQWIETLPFPLASILRVWQATPSGEYKNKVEHLLHFFEATFEFISTILLSAYSSNEIYFKKHKSSIINTLNSQNLSLQRASFGVWKVVIEYLSKQTRNLLSSNNDDDRKFCSDIFVNPSLTLPKMISNKSLVEIIATTNKMRNDWSGHVGIISEEESKLRNEILIGELLKLKEVMADIWLENHLVKCNSCKPRRGVIDNEVSILMGSNSQFLRAIKSMSEFLLVDSLYIMTKDHTRALRLLPLICFESSPFSAKNACYFFNRLEKGNIRFVSYHFVEEPEYNETLTEDSELSKVLSMDD